MELFLLVKCLVFLSACNRISCFFDFLNKHMHETFEGVVEYTICKEEWCEHYSPSYVQTTFPGVLLTEKQHKVHQHVYNESRIKYLQNEGVENVNAIIGLQGDGDSCCVTNLKTFINTSMTNINGKKRAIVHMPDADPPIYQFATHARCQTSLGGSCNGICVLEYVLLTFLVYDTVAEKMIFDQFLLPGYCSCKRGLY